MPTPLLNRDTAYFEAKNASDTSREIAQQPAVWRELAASLAARKDEISAFMKQMEAIPGLRVVFTGAGSSGFIGESMQMLLAAETGLRSEAVHTTEIVACPDATLPDVPTLLVSYSRSGESPESVAAVQYAEKRVSKLYNLVIVCKEGSSVANYAHSISDTLVLNMPPKSCDQGFAMTSSVSCMALATWCAFGWKEMDRRIAAVKGLADCVEAEMDNLDAAAQKAAAWDFDRLVYLGSGALRGLAREGGVKMLELTAGAVNTGWDTPTGFRHGPKSVINGTTVTVHFLSGKPFTRLYDNDLIQEIIRQRKNNKVVAVAASPAGAEGADLQVTYTLPDGLDSEIGDYIGGMVFSQLYAMEKSIARGNNVDSPSSGEVNRVVEGVVIHPLG